MRLFRFSLLMPACMIVISAMTSLIDRALFAAVHFMVGLLGNVSPAAMVEVRDGLALQIGLRRELDPALLQSLRHEAGVPRYGSARNV